MFLRISSEDHFEPSITGVLASSVSGPETGLKATLVAILDHVVPTKGHLAVWTTAPAAYALIIKLKCFRNYAESDLRFSSLPRTPFKVR